MKKHKKYQCEQFDKRFDNLHIEKMHILISHKKTKLLCHFFNTEKLVPLMTDVFLGTEILSLASMIDCVNVIYVCIIMGKRKKFCKMFLKILV